MSDTEFPNSLKCPICLDLFHNPVKTQCGHLYCFSCIAKHMERRDSFGIKCPYCNQEITTFPNKATKLQKQIRKRFPSLDKKRNDDFLKKVFEDAKLDFEELKSFESRQSFPRARSNERTATTRRWYSPNAIFDKLWIYKIFKILTFLLIVATLSSPFLVASYYYIYQGPIGVSTPTSLTGIFFQSDDIGCDRLFGGLWIIFSTKLLFITSYAENVLAAADSMIDLFNPNSTSFVKNCSMFLKDGVGHFNILLKTTEFRDIVNTTKIADWKYMFLNVIHYMLPPKNHDWIYVPFNITQ